MSAAESEESRWPDLATASIRTQSIRSTVAQRSSSAVPRRSSPACGSRAGAWVRDGPQVRHVGESTGRGRVGSAVTSG